MDDKLVTLLERIRTDINERISIANDAIEDGETDIANLLGTEVDHYFDFELPELVLRWQEGRL